LANYNFDRLFSPREADELIPVIEPLLRKLQDAAREIRAKITTLIDDDPQVERMQLPVIV
jgi:hypothetical protein